MTNKFTIRKLTALVSLFVLLVVGQNAWGQVNITDNSTKTESFTGYLGTSTYPANWDMLGTGSSYGFRGTAQTTGTSGGWYGNNNMSFLGSSNASNGNATWKLYNSSGSNITSFNLSFTGRLWKAGSASPTVRVYYLVSASSTFPVIGTSGWTEISSCAYNDATTNISTGASISSGTVSLTVTDGQYLYLRWIHPGGASSDNLGWDEISFTPTLAATGTSTLSAGSGTEVTTISSLTNTSASAASAVNFDFTFTEGDAAVAGISQIVINQGVGDAFTDWSQAILGAELSDGTTTETVDAIGTTSLTFSGLPYSSSGDFGYIAANDTKTYTLTLWLKSLLGGTLPSTIDGMDFVFEVTNSSLTMEAGGLAASQSVNSGDGNNVVDVVPTVLNYIQQPTNAIVGASVSPSVTVEMVDANGNRDLDYVSLATINITATGATLTGSPVSSILDAAGIATFNSIQFSTSGTGVTLTAEDIDDIIGTSNETLVSDAFDVSVNPCANTAIPWLEGFEGLSSSGTTIYPSCWLKENGDWRSAIASTNTYNDPHTGTYYITDTYSATNEYIWTPGFTLTAGTSYDFSFWFAGDNRSGWTGDVFYNGSQTSIGATQLGSSFITSGTTSTSTYAQVKRIFVPATTGTYYFAIRINANSTPWYIGFDDFSLKVANGISITGTDPTTNDFMQGSTDNVLYQFQMDITSTDRTLTDVWAVVNSVTANLDALVNNYKLWISVDNDFTTTGDNTLVQTLSSPATATNETISFTGLSQSLTAGSSYYFFVTTDVLSTATIGETLTIDEDNILIDFTGSPTIDSETYNTANSHEIIASALSDIILNTSFTEPSNIAYASYQATDIVNDATSIEVAQYILQDGGGTNDGDGASTELTNITFSLTNSANIRRVALYDGTTEIAEVAGGATVTFSGISITAADNATKTFSIRVSFNASVTDNENFQFTITSATANTAGSVFAATNAGGAASTVNSDENRIEVTTDRLVFATQPPATGLTNTDLSTQPVINATDALGNTDLDYSSNVDITNSGALGMNNSTGLSVASGVLTFPSNFQFTQPGTVTITVAENPENSITDAASSEITITIPTTTASVVQAVVASETAIISSLENDATIATTADGVQVWQFELHDGNGTDNDEDLLPTIYTDFTFTQGGSNTVANWGNAIQNLQFFYGTTLIDGTVTVNATTIVFTPTTAITVADGTTPVVVSMRLSLANPLPADSDNKLFQFELTQANTSVETSTTSSQLNFTTINSSATDNVIEVIATEIQFVQQPTDTGVTGTMSPNPTVMACDVNGNVDADYSTAISVTSFGDLTGTPVSGTWSNGVATFSNLVHTTAEANIRLTATSGSFSAISDVFAITDNLSFCDDFEDNFADWTVTDDPAVGAGMVIGDEPGGTGGASSTSNCALFDCPTDAGTYTSSIEKTFINVQDISVNFWYYFEDYRGGEINLYLEGTKRYSITYDGGLGNIEITESGTYSDDNWHEITIDLSSWSSSSNDYTIKIEGVSTADGWTDRVAIDELCVTGDRPVNCNTPLNQPTALDLNDDTHFNSIYGTFTASAGNPTANGYLVLRSSASDWSGTPTDGVVYSAGNIINDGTNNATVVDMITGTTFTASSLTASTTYYFYIFAYQNTSCANGPSYLTTSPLTGNETTPAGPMITLTGSLSNFGEECVGSSTASSTYTVGGAFLTSDITITAPTNFEISLDNSDFSVNPISLAPTAGTVATTTIYVRFSPEIGVTGAVSDNITHEATDVTTSNMAVAGTARDGATLTTDAASLITETSATSGGNITDDGTSAVIARGVCWNTTGSPTIADDLTSDGTGSGIFTSSLTGLTHSTTYYVRAYATNGCGTIYGNEEIFTTNCATVTSLPYHQNFDAFNEDATGTSTSGVTTYVAEECWENETGEATYSTNWIPESGTTPSDAATGPSGDHTSGSGKYMYIEASSATSAYTANLVTPTFDFSSFSNPQISFWYHMYGANMGSLQIDLFYDGTWHTNLWNLSGDQTDNWYQASVDISAAANYSDVQVRFSGITGSGYLSDIAIDDIYIKEVCTPSHTITSFAPTSGTEGAEVTISGSGYIDGSTTIYFNGVIATEVTFIDANTIMAVVPADASTGKINVVISGCELESTGDFTIFEETGTCVPGFSDLLITELYDGYSGSLGYIEVYNGSTSTIDLSAYEVRRYGDANDDCIRDEIVDAFYGFPNTGTGSSIASGQTLIGKIGTGTSSVTEDFVFENSNTGFNECDELELWNGPVPTGVQIDEVITQNVDVGYSYYRKETVTGPNTTFDPDEWTYLTTESAAGMGGFAAGGGPNITLQPVDVESCGVDMIVEATGTSLTYQWKYNDGSSAGWTDLTDGGVVSGATSNNLIITGDTYDNFQFYCEVSGNGGCTSMSNTAQFDYVVGGPYYRSKQSGNWNDNANWEMSTDEITWYDACEYPNSTNSDEVTVLNTHTITVPSYATSSETFTADLLTIESGAVLEIAAAGQLTVTNLVNSGNETNLIIRSTSGGTGSLLQSTGAVAATIERYLTGGDYLWHQIISPLTGASLPSGSGYNWTENVEDFWNASNIFGWNGTAYQGYVSTGWGSTGSFSNNEGTMLLYGSEQTATLTGGTLEDGDKLFNVTYTDHSITPSGDITNLPSDDGTYSFAGCLPDWSNYDGWIFVGNPYACAIDWSQVPNDDDIENGAYMWNSTSGNYVYYLKTGATGFPFSGLSVNDQGNDVQFIPAGQGFFVKATQSGSFTIPALARTHTTHDFWKKGDDKQEITNLFRMNIEQNGFTDETVVWTYEGSTDNHDGDFDLYKRFSMDNTKPQLYTANPTITNLFALNTFPEIGESKDIPVGVKIGTVGQHTINFTENTYSNVNIYLEDVDQNQMINVRTTPSYTFTADETGTFTDRFILHFNPNNAPVIANQPENQTTDEDVLFEMNLSDVFTDIDVDDELTFEYLQLPEWLSQNELTITGTPTNDEVGFHTIEIKATDLADASVTAQFTLEVVNVNDAPMIANQPDDQITDEDVLFEINLSDVFTDIDVDDVLSFEFEELPVWISQNELTLSGTPTNDEVGQHLITMRATDLASAYEIATFTITVENINDAPIQVIQISDYNGRVGQDLSIDLDNNTFVDVDINDVITYTSQFPTWLTFDPFELTYNGIPEEVGTFDITIVATDFAGAATSAVFSVNVDPALSIINVDDMSISIYPNPSNGVFVVNCTNIASGYSVRIIDITGKLVDYKENISDNKFEIDLSTQAVGVYYFELISGDQVFKDKLIKY